MTKRAGAKDLRAGRCPSGRPRTNPQASQNCSISMPALAARWRRSEAQRVALTAMMVLAFGNCAPISFRVPIAIVGTRPRFFGFTAGQSIAANRISVAGSSPAVTCALVRRGTPPTEDHPECVRRAGRPEADVRRSHPRGRALEINQGHRVRASSARGCKEGARSGIRGSGRPRP